MNPILRAAELFVRNRGLWRFALLPLAWGALAYGLVVLMIAGTFLGLFEWVASRTGHSAFAGGVVGFATGFAVAIFFGGGIYLALVAVISGFGFERLSAEVERLAFGTSVGKSPSLSVGIVDGLVRGLFAVVLGVVALCGSPTFVIPLLVASLLSVLDATAPAFARRGVRLGLQIGRVRRLRGVVSFALVSGLIVLVPVLNVLALPILVAAGTILVADAEGGAGYSPPSG